MCEKLVQITKQEFLDKWSGPEIVYKYRNWDTPRDREILSKREIFLSKFSKFHSDDPDEGKLRLDFGGINKNFVAKQIFNHPQNQGHNRMERRVNAKKTAKNSALLNKRERQKILESFFVPWDEARGVFCVTTKHENEYMWNKFAKNGSGICIAFSLRKLFDLFSFGQSIIYKESLPKISAHLFFDATINSNNPDRLLEIIDNRYRTKLKTFEKEEEFRLVSVTNGEPLEKRKLILPEDAYLKIYTGPAMSTEKSMDVLKACEAGGLDISLIEKYTTS